MRICGSSRVAGEQRRDGQEQLVEQPGGDERAQQRRAALAQQRADAARAQVAQRGRGRGVLEPDDLDRRGHLRRARVLARVDQDRLLGRLEQAGFPRDVEAAREQDGRGVLGEAGRQPPFAALGAADEPVVALGADRAGADEHRVGQRAQLEQLLEVGLTAEAAGAAVDRGAPVGGRDHVREHVRAIGRRALVRADGREQVADRFGLGREHGGDSG